MFPTLEEEKGIITAVVGPSLLERQRRMLITARNVLMAIVCSAAELRFHQSSRCPLRRPKATVHFSRPLTDQGAPRKPLPGAHPHCTS